MADKRETRAVGTVGLATFDMGSIEQYVETVLRNELNRNRANVARARTATGMEMQSLRAPIIVEAVVLELKFVSVDALLDAADGRAVMEIRVHELGKGLTFSRTFTVGNQMSVAWPNLEKNERIVRDLVEKLADRIVNDPEFRSRILLAVCHKRLEAVAEYAA